MTKMTKMTNMTKLLIPTLLATFAFVGGSSDAAAKKRGHKRGHHMKICEKIECTDAQKKEIEALRTEHKAEMAPLREEAKKLRAAYKAERSKANPDPKVLENLRAKKEALHADKRELRHQHFEEMKSLLTPEQVAELEKLKAQWKAKHKDGKKRGKGHHKGAKGKDKAKNPSK